jgi:hypothetical protein
MSSIGTDPPIDPAVDREIEDAWFRRLVTYSLLSAMAAAIPIPFVDEHLLRRTRRRLAREMAGQATVTLHEIEIDHLSGTGPSSLSSCLLGCIIGQSFKVVVKLVRRVFRSVLIFLTVKDAVDAFSKTFHEGFLLHRALPGLGRQLDARQAFVGRATGASEAPVDQELPRDRELVPEILTLRRAIESTCSEVDTRPLESTIKTIFRQSARALRRAARVFARDARRAEKIDPDAEPDAEEGRRLAPELVDLLTSSLQRKQGYLLELDRHFKARWSPGGSSQGGEAIESNIAPG